jgi:AcrR family transcriptional regulator
MGEAARKERRQEFIDAGWRCVARTGYRNLSVEDVCVEAGLSKGSFYTHFDRKADLLLALLDADASGDDRVIGDLSGSNQSATVRIRGFLREMSERGEDPAVARLRADLWAEVANDTDLREEFARRVRDRRALLAGWINDAVASGELVEMPANALAAIMLAFADGLMVHAAIDPGGFRWSNVRKAVGLLLDGLQAD